MKLHHFVGILTAYKLAFQPMRTTTSWHENTSVFHDRLIFWFPWNGHELSETISEDKWVRNTGLQISSFFCCRTIRRSCGLISPNDTLKQFDHNQLVDNRVQVSDGAQKIILERTKELPLRPCGCPSFRPIGPGEELVPEDLFICLNKISWVLVELFFTDSY